MNIFPKPKLLAIAQLNDKSQLVIPKDAREAIGIGPGDRVVIALAPFAQALVIARPDEIEKHLDGMVSGTEDSVKHMRAALKDVKAKETKE